MERAAETHVQLVTPAGTLIADVALRPDDTLHDPWIELGPVLLLWEPAPSPSAREAGSR